MWHEGGHSWPAVTFDQGAHDQGKKTTETLFMAAQELGLDLDHMGIFIHVYTELLTLSSVLFSFICSPCYVFLSFVCD